MRGVNEYRFTVNVPPVSKNALKGMNARGKIIRTRQANRFMTHVSRAANGARLPAITDGSWAIEVTAYWPRRLKVSRSKRGKAMCGGGDLRGGPFPDGDSDATAPLVRDALEEGLFVDDDARITTTIGHSKYDKGNPRVEVTLRRID